MSTIGKVGVVTGLGMVGFWLIYRQMRADYDAASSATL